MKIDASRIQKKVNDLGLDFIVLEYVGYTKRNLIKHSCGFTFEMRMDHLINRKKCPNCHGRKRNLKKFQEESNRVHNEEYEILEFDNGNKPVRMIHKICGNEFLQVGFRHLRGDRCPFCYRNFKYSKEDIIKISREKYDSEYELLSDEIHYDKKCLIKHSCGYEYYQIISSHLLGMKCPRCAGNAPHTLKSVQEKSNLVHSGEYKILGKVDDKIRSLSKVKILHNLCGKEFEQVVTYHLSGHSCPFCMQSKGETIIERLLTEKNILFQKQKTFDKCRYKNRLRFDFYLPDKNVCIEYDGYQHFYPIGYFGGKRAFELQKIKDEIKNVYCLDNNIHLIRVKYDLTLDKVDDIIKSL